jgi:transcriptional regulator PpsR
LAKLLDRIPDGFVVIDGEGIVRLANQAFIDLAQAGAAGAVLGRRLDNWLRPPGAGFGTFLTTLRRHGKVRLLTTTLQSDLGTSTDVELSVAGDTDVEPSFLGIILRDVGRRLAQPHAEALQSSLPALDPLGGKTSLRGLVQSSVGVLERHYLASALQMADGNRTAAAELLGLSRQSLYTKLNRYGLESGKNATSQSSD